MQRLVLILMALAILGLSHAQAQGSWVGLRSGYPLGVTLHYGMVGGFTPDLDMRISANVHVRGGATSFGVALDALSVVTTEGPFEVYVGGGPSLDFGAGGALFGVHGLAGGEFRLRDLNLDQLGIFLELAVGAAIGIGRPSIIPTIGAGVGFNWRF